MSQRLQGKSCLVTAAAQGIGRETAIRFAAEGAQVLATDISEEKLQLLATEHPQLRIRVLDVTDAQAINAMLATETGFDVVFNCAGYVHQGTILECDDEDWRRSFMINVDAMYRICRAVIPGMIDRGGGVIINMSSVASSIRGVPNRFAYSTTKAAVIGLTKSIAADFVSKGIRCNAICPGTVRTPSLQERVQALPGNEQDNWQAFISRQPMGRLGEAGEIASLAVYLVSDESSFTTGALHVIDGGWTS